MFRFTRVSIWREAAQYFPWHLNNTKLSHSKHATWNKWWVNVGAASQTVGQHYSNIGTMFCVCRELPQLNDGSASKSWINVNFCTLGGGPRVVVSTTAFHARVRGSVPGLGGLKETKNVSSPSTCESQYCGEPPWPRGSVLGLRPPGLEFRILCLEDSVISSSHHPQEVLLAQFSLYVHKGGLKPDSFHFIARTLYRLMAYFNWKFCSIFKKA